MKLNWVNILATILIVGGVCLLVKRQHVQSHLPTPTTRPMTDEEVKARVYAGVQNKLGRPLDDIEKQMITIVRTDKAVQVTIVEPLRSRVMVAQHQRSATQGSGVEGVPTVPGLDSSPSSSAMPPVAPITPSPMLPATAPTSP